MGNSLTCCCRRPRAREHATLYEVLGVAATGSRNEIDAAMRRLADAHGPGSDGDAKLFEQAKQAHDVLLDPFKRARYDESLEDEPSGYSSYSQLDQARRSGGTAPVIDDAGDSSVFGLDWIDRRVLSTLAGRDIEPEDGFCAAETSYGIWNEPSLQQYRLPSDDMTFLRSQSVGAFGVVWLAQVGSMYAAVKRLKREDQTPAKAVALATEIVRMTQLEHPKITKFMGVAWTKHWETQAVAEFLPGGDLREMLQSPKAEALTWSDFKCQVTMDVVDALAYLQTVKGVMESFTSRNILLETNGNAKLSVFAAARGRLDLLSNPQYLEWVAPEIILGLSDGDPAKSAIYSLGVLLCELDTTKPPFFDAVNPDGSPMSPFKIAQLVAMGKLRPSVSQECPDGIALLASECLAFDPQARPAAASIAYRLRDVLKNEL